MSYYDGFSPYRPEEAISEQQDRLYSYGAIAAAAGAQLREKGVADGETIGLYMWHPNWPFRGDKDAQLVKAVGGLSARVVNGDVSRLDAGREIHFLAARAASILTKAQLN